MKHQILKDILDYSWLGLDDEVFSELDISTSPLLIRTPEFKNDPIKEMLRLAKTQEFIFWTAKYIFNITLNMSQVIFIENMLKYRFPMVLCSRGWGKSFMMALYVLMRAFWQQGIKIVVVGSGFRQSKYVFEYCEKICATAPVLLSMFSKQGKPHVSKQQDAWRLHLGDSRISALPIGPTGEKIRGERASIVVADEFACLGDDTIVQTNFGPLKIKDTFRDDIEIQSGLNPSLFRRPARFIKTNQRSFLVSLADGSSFRCSERHKVFVRRGNSIRAIKLLDLAVGDEILRAPSLVSTVSYDINHNPFYLGCSSEQSSQLHNLVTCLITNNNILGQNSELVHSHNLDESHSFSYNKRNSSFNTIKSFNFLVNLCGLSTNPVFFLGEKLPNFTKVAKIDFHKLEETLYDYQFDGDDKSFIANGHVHHNSMNEDVFERVISGFNAVSSKPIEGQKRAARRKKRAELGLEIDDLDSDEINAQTIISGTAKFQTNHFYKYWRKYKEIIESKGDLNRLRALNVDPQTWKDYCIIRIPYELIPEGFMEDDVVSRAKAVINTSVYANEYGAVFSTDSTGFFKHSTINACTTTNQIMVSGGEAVQFGPRLVGDRGLKYYYGIDPASQVDNFSIVILEQHRSHRRLVYCWTINKDGHQERLSKELTDQQDYYAFCTQMIRKLMQVFPPTKIAIDAQGGGRTIINNLKNKSILAPGEQLVFEVVIPGKPKLEDNYQGLHILEPLEFANYQFVTEANHGLKQDMEQRNLLFPHFDPILYAEVNADNRSPYDGLDDIMAEIEALKEELTTIVVTSTTTGKDRWDTPQYKTPEGKTGHLRKDRYSAILMANYSARTDNPETYVMADHIPTGDVLGAGVRTGHGGYIGNPQVSKVLNESLNYCGVVG